MSGFNFRLNKILKEAAEADQKCGGECDLDQILSDTDLQKIMDGISPITGEVAGKLQEQMANPMDLRIILDENSNQFYMDYNELINYCEASGKSVKTAVESIFEAYKENYDFMTLENFNIVFPSKEMFTEASKEKVGYQDMAWSSHFLANCKNEGLRCTTFVDPGMGPEAVKVTGKEAAPDADDPTVDPE